MRRSICLCFVVALAGCGSVQSVLVPMALNPIAAPSRGRAQAHIRGSANTGVDASEEPGSVAMYLPRVQIEGGAAVRAHEYFTIRLQGGSFLDVDAQRVGSSRASAPGLAGWLLGVAPTLTLPLDHGRTLLALGPDITFVIGSRVWREYETCPDPDDPAGPPVECGADYDQLRLTMMFGGTASASRWLGDFVRLTGTVGVRGQPGYGSAFASDMPTDFGHVAVVLGAELLFQITNELVLAVESQWLGVAAPYVVYPTVGLTFGGSFGHGPGEDPREPTIAL